MSALAGRAHAAEPAKTLNEVWPEIQSGRFDLAAQRLEMHLKEWPLDHDVRFALATLQFGAEMFDEAQKNAGRVVKLRRGFASNQGFDVEYVEAWYRVMQRRAGHAPDAPRPASPHSLLVVMAGTADVDTFAAEATSAYLAHLDELRRTLGNAKTTTVDGVPVTVTTTINAPQRQAVERTYLCIGSFMLGELALGLGQLDEARKRFDAAIASEAAGILEFHIAKAELTRLT